VGRSAAAKAFDPETIDLAVAARVRHAHTRYDDLLLKGWYRDEARHEVQGKINAVLAAWSGPAV
jgi:hypothetical protein